VKYLTLLLAPLFVFAAGSSLTPMEHSSIHGYQNSPTLKMKTKQKMHKLHNVDEKEVTKIVKKETKEDVVNIKLTHIGNYLLYKATTTKYRLQINALDGTVMKKELKI
jgi:uncharacterized membrane protein YkoI